MASHFVKLFSHGAERSLSLTSLVPGPSLLLRAGEGPVTFAIKTVAGSYMMLHNHILVSAPCHMIAVMKDDGLIHSSSWQLRATVANRSMAESPCRFGSIRQYLTQQYSALNKPINCYLCRVIVNQDIFVRNFHAALF